MTPLGHAAVSALAARATPRVSSVLWLAAGMAPDLDFLLLPLPGFDALHRVVTHNLFFVTGVALVCALIWGRYRALALLCALAAGLGHLFIDSVMDSNPANGIGVAFFWPLDPVLYSPFNLLTPQPGPGWADPWEMLGRAAGQLLWEIPFWIAALVLWRGPLQKRLSRRAAKP